MPKLDWRRLGAFFVLGASVGVVAAIAVHVSPVLAALVALPLGAGLIHGASDASG